MANLKAAVLIDNGSYMIKAGVAGEDAPRTVFPTRSKITPNSPIDRGLVTNWDDMEKIWFHTLYDYLKVIPEEHPVILTERTFNTNANRERMIQIMFEKFNVPAVCLANQGVMALLNTGRTTGVAVESGHGFTEVVPVHEGKVIRDATMRLEIGGYDATEYLTKLLNERGFSFRTKNELEIVQDIKEKICFTAANWENEMERYKENPDDGRSYEMPDGTNIRIGDARFRCGELLFQPALVGIDSVGVHELIHNAIMKVDPSIKNELYNSICLSGGNTMLSGLEYRLRQEILTNPAGHQSNIKVRATDARKYAVWGGLSLFGEYDEKKFIQKQEYEDYGTEIVYRKCVNER